jgi:hemoglobin
MWLVRRRSNHVGLGMVMITLLHMADDDVPTLYAWAGGKTAFERLINAFYDRVEKDELLSPLFGGAVTEEHREHVVAWWSEVFGAPQQRFRFASLMSLAADDADLPADPEFRAAFVGYVEWGTRIALGNSAPGAQVMQEAPVPKWGWGVAPPYQPGS